VKPRDKQRSDPCPVHIDAKDKKHMHMKEAHHMKRRSFVITMTMIIMALLAGCASNPAAQATDWSLTIGPTEIVLLAAGIVATWAFTEGITKIRNRITQRSSWRRVWKFEITANRNTVKIITANTPDDIMIMNNRTLIGYANEYMGASKIMSYFGQYYRNIHFDLDMERFVKNRDLNDNIVFKGDTILIGGPVHNPATAHFMREYNIPLRYNDHVLQHIPNSIDYKPKIGRSNNTSQSTSGNGTIAANGSYGRIEEDITLIVNTKNKYDDGRTILISGSHTIGCHAGAYYLTQSFKLIRKDIKKLAKEKGKKMSLKINLNYAMVLRTVCNDYYTFNEPQLIDFIPL
jgi:hypothetical protein